MLAITLSCPPQRRQVSMSIEEKDDHAGEDRQRFQDQRLVVAPRVLRRRLELLPGQELLAVKHRDQDGGQRQ
jgi:hypothetical protein